MSAAKPPQSSLMDRVYSATAHLLLHRGARRIRTAEIAVRSGTTESTLFRHFEGIEDILEKTYARCWSVVNAEIAASAFENPTAGNPEQQLLSDMRALWLMRADEEKAEAATVAFLLFRRRAQVLRPDAPPADDEVRFRRRLNHLAESIAGNTGGDRELDGRALSSHLMNYAATVWLTWFCMPTGSDDPFEEHDLTLDEAEMGVRVLIDTWRTGPRGAVDSAQPAGHG